MDCVVVCLRDMSTTPCKILIRIKEEVPIGAPEDGQYVSVEETLKKFYEAASSHHRALLRDSDLNVYIGLWGSQGSFRLPPELLALIGRNFWTVDMDFND